jgi:thiol-disulfide isomerase/thioredoxin
LPFATAAGCGNIEQRAAAAALLDQIKEVVMLRAIASCAWILIIASNTCFAAAQVGETAPDIVLGTTLSGKPAKASDYAGKVVVISFWASWCSPCRKELPILEGLQVTGKGSIQVVAVNIESREVFQKAAKVLGELHLMLANDRDDRSQHAYAVKAIPQMVIIGKDGRILDIHKGYGENSLNGIVEEINRALAANSPETASNS